MHYLLIYDLAVDYLERRAIFRSAHLQLAQEAVEKGELILGGALDNPADHAILLFFSASPSTAEIFAQKDPYVLNGLVLKWQVRKWITVVGKDATFPVVL